MKPRTPLARAIKRKDWDLAALYALLSFAHALRQSPDATLEDLLAALTFMEDADDGREQ
jgi:hypothetical protein